jgi:hypothetical protein
MTMLTDIATVVALLVHHYCYRDVTSCKCNTDGFSSDASSAGAHWSSQACAVHL